MKLKQVALLIVVTIALAGCADEHEIYTLQNPSAPVSEATLTISGENANLVVIYTDKSRVELPGKVQRSKSSAQTFTLTIDSSLGQDFEFDTIPQLKTGTLKCVGCLNMSAVKRLKPSTSLVEWARAPKA